MAKNLYNVTFKSNFSFRKLGSKLEDVLGSSNGKIIDELAQMTKRNITDGKLRSLSPATISAREKGISSFSGHSPSPKPGEKRPLLYTGRLLKSIKPVKDGIEMESYGLEHHEGFTTPEKKFVPSRKFIAGDADLKKDKKELAKVQDDLIINMQRVMKK